MPRIQWKEDAIHILGSAIGNHEIVASLWDKCMRNITASAKHHSTRFLTWTAKSLIVKSKILPLVTYNANVYPLPARIRQKISRIIEKFMAGHRNITIPIQTLVQPFLKGGYNVPDTALFCDLFLLRPIIDYIKHRTDHTPATAQNAIVEYQIGHQLSKLLDFPFKNTLPHIARPSVYYSHVLALVKKYKLNAEQLYKLSLRQIYHLLIANTRPYFADSPKWRSVHSDVLTNSLKTFNYRAIHEILPLSTKQYTAYLDTRSTCRFCQQSPEQPKHIFFTCNRIKPIWNFIKTIISNLDDTASLDLNYITTTHFMIPQQLQHVEKHIIYLFSIARQKIWTHRNNIEQNKTAFSTAKIIQSITRSTHRRLSMERQSTSKKHVRTFEDIQLAIRRESRQDTNYLAT